MIEIKCKYDELVNPQDLISHPKNPNKHPANQVKALAKNIERFGWRHPIIVSKLSGKIVMGHCRRDASKKLGCDVPVEYQDFKNDDEELAVLVADNVIPELAEMDESLLSANKELIEAAGFDLESIGFDLFVPDIVDNSSEEDTRTNRTGLGSESNSMIVSIGMMSEIIDKQLVEDLCVLISDKFAEKPVEEFCCWAVEKLS